MSEHYERHAEEVVTGFRQLLGEAKAAAIGEEHLRELAMMVESAISTSVLQELERAADKVAGLAEELRRHAERFD